MPFFWRILIQQDWDRNLRGVSNQGQVRKRSTDETGNSEVEVVASSKKTTRISKEEDFSLSSLLNGQGHIS